jgi:hypothetical protein
MSKKPRRGKPAATPALPQKPSAQPQGPRWPAHQIEQWEIGRLAPYAKNSRKHSAEQIEQFRASMMARN